MGRRNEMYGFIPTHPGSVLKEELEERGISQKTFAETIGMQPSNLNALLRGKRRLNLKTAFKLQKALGISYELWIGLQHLYDDTVEYHAMKAEELEEISIVAEPEAHYGLEKE